MKIYVGCDHAGMELRQVIVEYLEEQDYDVEVCLMHEYDENDFYPDAAYEVCGKVEKDENSRGILICGTGIGMSIAANRNKNIRAALCTNEKEAELTRLHNDANVLCMGGRIIGREVAKEITRVFLETKFSNDPKHIARIERLK